MGAAMGFDFEEAMTFRKQNNILFGVIGSHQGEMKDLWKYNKLETDKKEKGTLIEEFLTDLKGKLQTGSYPIFRKDVLIREFLVHVSLTIAIASKEQIVLSELRKCFYSPRYALTLGNSDDLFKIIKIGNIAEAEKVECFTFENTVLAGDLTLDYESAIDLKNTPITYRVRAPQVFLLPTSFSFKGEERRVSKRQQFTFVGSPIKLKQPLSVYKVEDMIFPLI
jgi:CRISPR-associated protein Cas5t